MKRFFTCIFLFLALKACYAQSRSKIDRKTQAIMEEGKWLYRSEMASWLGTDIFMEKYGDHRDHIGGYFSYPENLGSRCVFFSKGENPKVIGTIIFDSAFNTNTAIVDMVERNFSVDEFGLYEMRQAALKEIRSSGNYKIYDNTSLNLIPVIWKGEKKVYVLTGPQKSGVVIFGNDYLLRFNSKNKLTGSKQLHRNLIPLQTGGGQTGESIHSHVAPTDDFITPTDICTLMLYEKAAGWTQHIVVSKKYVCLWDCKKDVLFVLTRKAWDRIAESQKQRNKPKS